MSKLATSYDIIIVGGGIVGLLTARLLADLGFAIAVIDPGDIVVKETDWPLRVSAISLTSLRIFDQLHLGDQLLDQAGSYRDMHVWESGSRGSVHFNHQQTGVEHLGHIVPNVHIINTLYQQLQQLSNVSIFTQTKAKSLVPLADEHLVSCDGELSLRAKLIVGADGGKSWLRQQAGIATVSGDYGQSGVVGVWQVASGHQNTAWQRFLQAGPIAMLPLKQHDAVSMVWTMGFNAAKQFLEQSQKQNIKAINDALAGKLQVQAQLSKCASFSLHYHHARNYCQQGIVLVGDAAHVIHPLAGQGVNLGISDAASLSEVINQASNCGRKWWRQDVLLKYEGLRRKDNTIMQQAMHGFNKLFADSSITTRLLRAQGMHAVNNLHGLKAHLIKPAL